MKVLTVSSPKGGVGVTTIAAALAYALRTANLSTLACDLDPRNALRHHFGLDPSDPRGVVGAAFRGAAAGDSMAPILDGVHLLPFGRVTLDERSRVETAIAMQPRQFLAKIVDRFAYAADVLILDVPPAPIGLRRAAGDLADLEIVVAEPSGGAYAALSPADELLPPDPGGKRLLALNRMDPDAALHRQLRFAFTGLGELIATIERDPAAEEALAQRQTVLTWAENSPAAAALFQLGLDVAARLRADGRDDGAPT